MDYPVPTNAVPNIEAMYVFSSQEPVLSMITDHGVSSKKPKNVKIRTTPGCGDQAHIVLVYASGPGPDVNAPAIFTKRFGIVHKGALEPVKQGMITAIPTVGVDGPCYERSFYKEFAVVVEAVEEAPVEVVGEVDTSKHIEVTDSADGILLQCLKDIMKKLGYTFTKDGEEIDGDALKVDADTFARIINILDEALRAGLGTADREAIRDCLLSMVEDLPDALQEKVKELLTRHFKEEFTEEDAETIAEGTGFTVQVVDGKLLIEESDRTKIPFASGKSILEEASEDTLSSLVTLFNEFWEKGLRFKVHVVGHASRNVGRTDRYTKYLESLNLQLSQYRALAVSNFLRGHDKTVVGRWCRRGVTEAPCTGAKTEVREIGDRSFTNPIPGDRVISEMQITHEGKGDTQPRYTPATDTRNQRVSFVVTLIEGSGSGAGPVATPVIEVP